MAKLQVGSEQRARDPFSVKYLDPPVYIGPRRFWGRLSGPCAQASLRFLHYMKGTDPYILAEN